MSLKRLRLHNFRNLKNTTVELENSVITLIGENGQGKTNFLEAVYFSSLGSSFRTRKEREIIRQGERDFALDATFAPTFDSVEDDRLLIKYQGGEKRLFLNEESIKDRKDILGLNPIVLFCHEDMEFVRGTPEDRRWFFDHIQCFLKKEYVDLIRHYRKTLRTRNYLLKNSRLDLLPFYTEELVKSGMKLQEEREQTIRFFNTLFAPLYSEISGIKESVFIRYSPSWSQNEYAEILQQMNTRLDRDREQGFTTTGPHRDLYHFFQEGKDFSRLASTGQKRLLALVLRIAQAEFFKSSLTSGVTLLLDDVLLELDSEKQERFLAALPRYDQLFLSALPQESAFSKIGSDPLKYRVSEGELFHE